MADYKITRTNRKTMALYVHQDGSVEVKCPVRLPEDVIEKFIASKQKWLFEKVSQQQNRFKQQQQFTIESGSKLRLLGSLYPLMEIKAGQAGFDGTKFYIPVSLPKDEVKPVIIKLYKTLAKDYLVKRTSAFSEIMQVSPTNVKISSAKTRWGSCSGKNSVNLSWRLMMADAGVIDYVIIHELSHMKEHNHSKRFWAVVLKYMPDYQKQFLKLKALQKELVFEDWDS